MLNALQNIKRACIWVYLISKDYGTCLLMCQKATLVGKIYSKNKYSKLIELLVFDWKIKFLKKWI